MTDMTIADIDESRNLELEELLNNPYDITRLKNPSKAHDIHNIAAVLHLINAMIAQLNNIADNMKRTRQTAVKQWTEQAKASSESTQKAGMYKMGEALGPFIALAVQYAPLNAGTKATVKQIATIGTKTVANMFSQGYEASAQQQSQRSQSHQGDKDSLQSGIQSMDQSLQSATEGLRSALNTLGSQNKDASGH